MKTAVEWLVEQLNKQGFAQVVTDEEISQAKEMEKQQIIEACDYGKECLFKGKYLKSETYYEETFNK